MRVINFSEARNALKRVIDQVVSDADIAVITRRDAPDAVVMSLDTYNSMMETVAPDEGSRERRLHALSSNFARVR